MRYSLSEERIPSVVQLYKICARYGASLTREAITKVNTAVPVLEVGRALSKNDIAMIVGSDGRLDFASSLKGRVSRLWEWVKEGMHYCPLKLGLIFRSIQFQSQPQVNPMVLRPGKSLLNPPVGS